jgi:hypothetical protein
MLLSYIPDPYNWDLEVYPTAISLYGGEEVYFTGPCLVPEHQIKCRFGNQVVDGWMMPDTHSKGMCISPRLKEAGWIEFCVSIDGQSFMLCSKVHVG